MKTTAKLPPWKKKNPKPPAAHQKLSEASETVTAMPTAYTLKCGGCQRRMPVKLVSGRAPKAAPINAGMTNAAHRG